ncbi:hypothetical protein [Ideonella livida]|uniref:Uncharacterized protein n=1 Tax=Ideonella livida TaxID=2707176 RepID=A0A7C9TM81_9BURK|nr:hypothetical protein [Ideonella livida]NDY93004.1 hypothetical protein [Ideonella livida]
MRHPLLTLWRHHLRVLMFETGGLPPELGGSAATLWREPGYSGLQRRRFGRPDEAAQWLQFWRGDPAALADLRWVAQRLGTSTARQAALRPDDIFALLGEALWRGGLVVAESAFGQVPAGRLTLAPASAGGMSSALSNLPSLGAMPSIPVLPPLLPALEDLQVEGAGVLPEVKESIAQMKTGIDQIASASTSLTPAPDKVPEIQGTLKERSAAVRSTLDSL